MTKTPEDLSNIASRPFPVCNVLFYPSSIVAELIKKCTAVSRNQIPCNSSGTLSNERSYLMQACDAYYLPYTDCYATYKNIFCKLCLQESVNEVPIQCSKNLGYSTNNFPMFSALIDFDKNTDTAAKAPDENCGVGQLHDKIMVSAKIQI
jgi:hypothetical protein